MVARHDGRAERGTEQGAEVSALDEPTEKVFGRDLKVGDRIAPWGGRTATITDLTPYVGALAYLWKDQGGARMACFTCRAGDEWTGPGMTIEPQGTYDRVIA